MKNPKIKFRKSIKKDIETLLVFSSEAKYDNGRNLKWAVFNKYPRLQEYFDKDDNHKIKNKKKLKDFITKEYNIKREAMKKGMDQYKSQWKKISEQFYFLIKDLFGNDNWPTGKYVAYSTIWGMFPRFLNDKTFQIPYNHKKKTYVNVIIAHEMLHFKFYDYFLKKYPKYKKSKYNFFVWHVSEIFNEVIQNSPSWIKHFKLKSKGYPEHGDAVKRLSKRFYNNKKIDIDILTKAIISEVGRYSKKI